MDFSTITKEQIKEMLDRGEKPQLVDVRPYSLYWRERIRGALSIPYDKIADRAHEVLLLGELVILYGEDEHDAMVERSAEALVERKFDPSYIRIFPEGIVGWRGAGYITASGEMPMG